MKRVGEDNPVIEYEQKVGAIIIVGRKTSWKTVNRVQELVLPGNTIRVARYRQRAR